jgi:uncharacterized protein YbaP (TraB family)
MQQPGTVFVAVGAGHLDGPQNLRSILSDEGIKAERMK